MRALRAAALTILLLLGLGRAVEAEPRDVWVDRTTAKISAALTLPPSAKGMPEARRAIVRFTVDRNGRITDPAIETGTGNAALDKAALDAVRAADPLPPPPLPAASTTLVVRAPIAFNPGSRRSLERAQRSIGRICTGC